MSQQFRHGSAQEDMEPAADSPSAHRRTATAAMHCGRTMPVRRLRLAHPESGANHAVAQAAVDGRRLHACACGFLLETEVPAGGDAPIAAGEDERLFHPFFTRRVLAAAGRAETAEWAVDQQLAEAGGPGDPDRRRWLLEAGTETARWELDQAVSALHAELRLAARHGVPFSDLAEAAGLDEETVTAALRHVPAPPAPADAG